MIKQMTLELKIDDEVNVSLVSNWREGPCVCQMLQRTVCAGSAAKAVREAPHEAFRSAHPRSLDPIETASILAQSINADTH
jgi:hypothetical protein